MKCNVCGRTDEECVIKKVHGMALCPKHATQYYRHGDFLKETMYDGQKYIIDEENQICKIELKNKKREVVGYAIIDISDIEKCKRYKWYHTRGYARGNAGHGNKVWLHRLIIDCPDEYIVDHINHDKLDNRKENLRLSNHSYNAVNRAKDGTGIRKALSGRYVVTIWKDYKVNYIGTYDTYEEALEKRQEAYEKLFNNGNLV